MITVTINGKNHSFASEISLLDLFKLLDIKPSHKLVELRNTIYKETEFDSVMVQHDDQLEIIQFMGGGSGISQAL